MMGVFFSPSIFIITKSLGDKQGGGRKNKNKKEKERLWVKDCEKKE